MPFMFGSFPILFAVVIIMYPQIISDAIIIIIIAILTITPVFMLTIIVDVAWLSFLFVSSKFASFLVLSILLSAIFDPRFFSAFCHFKVSDRVLVSPGSRYTSDVRVQSSTPTISYPSGIVCDIFAVPASSPLFVTFM